LAQRPRRCALLFGLLLFAFFASLPATAAEPITLRVTNMDYFEPGPREVFEKILVPQFEAMHPGVKVEVEWIPWTGYVDVYTVRHAGGMLGDVIYFGSSLLGQFVSAGLIRNIDEYVRDWEDLADFVPSALEDVKINGQFYALPGRLDVRTLVYNRSYFEEAGLDKDTPPKTWDDLRNAARRTVKYNNEGNITRQGFDVHADFVHVLGFVYQAGGDYISHDGKAMIATDESIEAIEFLNDLIHVDRVALPTNGSWRLGNVAMMMDNPWLMELDPSVLDPGISPPLTYRQQVTNVHINKWGVTTQSQHPELAVEWLKFVLQPQNLALLSQEYTRVIPRISPMREYAPYSTDPRWNTWLTAAVMSKPLAGHIVELADVAGRYNATLREIFNGRAAPRTALTELAEYLNNNVLGKSRQ